MKEGVEIMVKLQDMPKPKKDKYHREIIMKINQELERRQRNYKDGSEMVIKKRTVTSHTTVATKTTTERSKSNSNF